MTTYIQFTPNNDATPPFSFNCTLDGDVYEIQLWWNVYGQRWYINCYDTNGTRIRTEPLIGSPDSGDIPMLPGLFSENTLVYRESSNNFEVS